MTLQDNITKKSQKLSIYLEKIPKLNYEKPFSETGQSKK